MVLSGVFVCYDQKLKPSGTSKSLKLIYTYNIILYLNTLFVFVKIEKKRIYNGQVDNGLRLMPYIMYIYIYYLKREEMWNFCIVAHVKMQIPKLALGVGL